MSLHFLTDREVALVQHVIDVVMDRIVGPANRPHREESVGRAPEVYVAYIPEAGIPALTPDPDTGTAGFAVPGVAECQISQIVVNPDTDDPELKEVEGLTRDVYNLSGRDLVEGWTSIYRDKFGKWLADTTPGMTRMCHGKLRKDLSTGNPTMEIYDVKTIFGPLVTNEDGEDFATGTGTGPDTSLTVRNVHGHSGDANARVTAVYCNEDEQWEEIQVDC